MRLEENRRNKYTNAAHFRRDIWRDGLGKHYGQIILTTEKVSNGANAQTDLICTFLGVLKEATQTTLGFRIFLLKILFGKEGWQHQVDSSGSMLAVAQMRHNDR